MKTYTVFYESIAGKSQAVIEASRYVGNDEYINFFDESDDCIASFNKSCFIYVIKKDD